MVDSKRQNNGMIPDIRNNNTLESEKRNLNDQHCIIQCSTAISQLSTISDNTSNYTTSITTTSTTSRTNTTGCSNSQNTFDHQITTVIDDSQLVVINSDLIETGRIEVTNVNNQKSSSTINDHSLSSTKSQSCLSPVIEDSNSGLSLLDLY